ncbi:MAG: extracellular solute-binding protein [Lachnospiraceae bacterium]
MRIKRLAAAGLAAAMTASLLGGCGGSGAQSGALSNVENAQGNGTAVADGEIVKPEKIKIMVDGTLMTKQNDRDAFEKRWEELTGIELEIIQPDHDAYYDVLGQTFASGTENWPDAIILSSTYYSGYAEEGALWDMTETWENSDLKASGRVIGDDVVENMKLNGKLYGLPVNRGNGCITYVKKAWLDNCGLEAPTTYEEYIAMLDAFTNGDPDGNGIDGDTYGVSAPEFMGKEAPYTIYLQEFYQGSYPSFVMGDDGLWYDGFAKDDFKEALVRLREAYVAGYIDKETLTNGTNDCRNKFYEDKFGVFTYWAGTWNSNLKNNLVANGHDGELIALPPIKEVGSYIERNSPVWAITATCENPEGVYKYLIESMMDGGDMQTLWSYGAEDVHWSSKAETVLENTYAEGEFHLAESLEKPGTQYTKQHLDPMLSLVEWDNDPGKDTAAPEAWESQTIFNENCHQIKLAPSTEEMASYNGDLITLKRSIVADVIVQGVSIEEAYARFEKDGGTEWSRMIVDSMNK